VRLEVQEKYFPLVPFNNSRLRICLNLKIDYVKSDQTLCLNGCCKQDRKRSLKIVLRDLRGARLCCRLALLYVGVWQHILLIQVKPEHIAPRAI